MKWFNVWQHWFKWQPYCKSALFQIWKSFMLVYKSHTTYTCVFGIQAKSMLIFADFFMFTETEN